MPPPLPPKELGFRLGCKSAGHTIDVFIDIACPFSKKIFKTLQGVYDWAQSSKPNALSVRFLVTPQPWHPQSPVLAEAVLAVQAIDETKANPFTNALFDVVEERFYDDSAYEKSRIQLNSELAEIASAFVSKEKILQMLAFKHVEGSRNTGNEVTQLLKWHVKYHRACGVHVTPTCFLNGIEAGQVSSSWAESDWREFLLPLIE